MQIESVILLLHKAVLLSRKGYKSKGKDKQEESNSKNHTQISQLVKLCIYLVQ